MTHDATHCLDCDNRCPPDCWRCELTRDLEKRPDLREIPMNWAHFRGTDECLYWPKRRIADSDKRP